MKEQEEVAIEMEIESIEWTFVSEDQLLDWYQITDKEMSICLQSVICQVHLFGKHISVVYSLSTANPNKAHLTISLMVVMQSSGYSIFHDVDTPIWLGLPWQNHSYQCLNNETSAQGNRGYITETLNISYSMNLYIRLVVIL